MVDSNWRYFMKSIRKWEDLKEYGIDVLTGEACAYGYRLLCDITSQGRALFQSVFSLTGVEMTEGWNDVHSRSVMLPRAMFEPLAVFALMRIEGCCKIFIMHSGEVYGIESEDKPEGVEEFVRRNQGIFCESCNRYGKGGGIHLQYMNPGYSRNRHQMSGRTT